VPVPVSVGDEEGFGVAHIDAMMNDRDGACSGQNFITEGKIENENDGEHDLAP
jgi:hypothetical protein